MISKKQAAETVILKLSGGQPSSESNIDERDVFNVLNNLAAEMIGKEVEVQLNRKGSFEVDSTWVKTFLDNIIQYNDELGQCYLKLPVQRISIDYDKDIRQISWMQGGSLPFPMEAQSSQQAWSQLEAGFVGEDQYPFYPDGDVVWFRTMPKRLAGSKVLVRMIAGIDGYAPEEVLPLPNNFAMILLERTAAFFMPQIQTKSKNTNDANVNTK